MTAQTVCRNQLLPLTSSPAARCVAISAPSSGALLEFRRGRGIQVAGTPERGAVLARARELVRFARQQGYRTDELIKIIESVG